MKYKFLEIEISEIQFGWNVEGKLRVVERSVQQMYLAHNNCFHIFFQDQVRPLSWQSFKLIIFNSACSEWLDRRSLIQATDITFKSPFDVLFVITLVMITYHQLDSQSFARNFTLK
jgi:hypothetical protein